MKPTRIKTTRRDLFGVGLASAAGLLGVASRMDAHSGTLTNEQVRKLAVEPKNTTDYGKLAEHFRTLKTEAEKEAALYEGIAKVYRRRLPGATEGQGRDAARALEHVAEHARDSAEALDHVVETYEALAENFYG